MNSKKLYYLLIAVLVLLGLGLVGVAYGANTLLSKQSKKLADVKAKSLALEAQEQQLAKNRKDIEKYTELNKIAQAIVPQDKDQAEAVREIVNIAAQSGITNLSSITFPASTLGNIAIKGTPASGGVTQVTPVKGIAGVYALQITVTQDATNRVSYSKFTTFLSKLEQNRRTAQVSSINVQPDPRNPDQVAFTLIIDEFIKP
jgi:hypothetical protein